MNRVAVRGVTSAFVLLALSVAARAQFRETAPAPYTPAVARVKIRALLENATPDNRKQTADTLSGLLVWYRDIADDELIAAWKGDARGNVAGLIAPLADARVASAIIQFSWVEQRQATFNLTYAPVLGNLLARYQASAGPFLQDLQAPAVADGPMSQLTQPEADAVCRILLDMPDTGNWRKIALQTFPHLRPTVQNLLVQDLHGSDQEKVYRAQSWLTDLRWNVPGITSEQQRPRRASPPPPAAVTAPIPGGNQITSNGSSQRPHIVDQPATSFNYTGSITGTITGNGAGSTYSGPASGTLKCSGGPILPDGEYVFPGMPPGNIQVDVGGKPWDARLVPGTGQTQTLILRNKGAGPQKGCTVRWHTIP
jgi:hypothetical protein